MKIKNFIRTSNAKKKPKYLVIMIHGYGSNAKDIIEAHNGIYTSIIDESVIIAPNAPTKCDINANESFQWFKLYESEQSVRKTLKESIVALNEFIDNQLESEAIYHKNLMLFGFSQGAMLAMHAALNRNIACSNVIFCSGMTLFSDELEKNIKSKPKFCIIHGENDHIISVNEAENTSKFLLKNNIEHEKHIIQNLEHHIDSQSIKIMNNYIKKTNQTINL